MGKGRDGMKKCVPVPGRIFNFHPYPFPSRTNWLFRHPVPCVPERLRFGSRPRPQRKKINIFITKYFVHQIWLLRLIWHLGSSYWVSNFKIPASLSVPLISIPIPYHPFFIFKFGSPSRPGMGRLNWIPSRPAAHLWFLPCCHIFIFLFFETMPTKTHFFVSSQVTDSSTVPIWYSGSTHSTYASHLTQITCQRKILGKVFVSPFILFIYTILRGEYSSCLSQSSIHTFLKI